MSYREELSRSVVAISISESADMPTFGMSDQHLSDAMVEIARHLLALGARLVYGGDLREQGFTELLFELIARHSRDADEGDNRHSVLNYLAWPVHIQIFVGDLERQVADVASVASQILLGLDGRRLSMTERQSMVQVQPSLEEWAQGLTVMRQVMCADTNARIVMGGRVEQFKGSMPGIAQEALLSLQARQPLYLVGGFGGCSRDIAGVLGLVDAWTSPRQSWSGRHEFEAFNITSLNNGLTELENATLARTPHVDQAVALILRGLLQKTRDAEVAIPGYQHYAG